MNRNISWINLRQEPSLYFGDNGSHILRRFKLFVNTMNLEDIVDGIFNISLKCAVIAPQ